MIRPIGRSGLGIFQSISSTWVSRVPVPSGSSSYSTLKTASASSSRHARWGEGGAGACITRYRASWPGPSPAICSTDTTFSHQRGSLRGSAMKSQTSWGWRAIVTTCSIRTVAIFARRRMTHRRPGAQLPATTSDRGVDREFPACYGLPIRLIVRLLLVLLAALAVAGWRSGGRARLLTSRAAARHCAEQSTRTAPRRSTGGEYGTTAAYDSETPRRQLTFGGRSRTPVSEPISGLAPDTTYHFRLCAQAPDFDAFCGDERTFTTQPEAQPTELSITGSPALYPSFDPDITDYVTRCGDDPVEFDIEAPQGTDVSVDGAAARSGGFTEEVQLAAGQRAAITATAAAAGTQLPRPLPAAGLPGLDPRAKRRAQAGLHPRQRRRGGQHGAVRGLLQ